MIPAPFEYASPTDLDEAVRLLGEAAGNGDDAKIIAGGQSLLPVMKLRLAAPEMIIDLGRIESLRGVSVDGDTLVIGAMTTHHQVATDPTIAEHAELLSITAGTIADPQVRHRGTFGGAVVHADPAGDLPAAALALGAEFVIIGAEGRRTVPASEFFVDLFTTDVGEDEILAEVRIPSYRGWGAAYEKFVRVSQQWSIVAVAACVRVEGGTIAEARIGLTNMGSTPIRALSTEQALTGTAATAEAVSAAVASITDQTAPPEDVNGDAEYRRHLAKVIGRRAVLKAAGAE